MASLSKQALAWKQLMDNGVFDECYPQRLNAAFHYLCSENLDSTTFSLKVVSFIEFSSFLIFS
jgi:hypothetical protein